MTYKQVYNFYKDKRDADCKYTKELIENGFYQRNNGYIDVAISSGLISIPSQWWHLMQYCLGKYERHEENKKYPYTPCGELKFWMAEVSGAFTDDILKDLKNRILYSEGLSRSEKNRIIHDTCWEKIKNAVEEYSAT